VPHNPDAVATGAPGVPVQLKLCQGCLAAAARGAMRASAMAETGKRAVRIASGP
jgi:hypothetical protein